MKDFKFFRNEESVGVINLMDYETRFTIAQPSFQTNNVEFCFQFNDEEPVVFGRGPNDLHIHISPSPNGNVTFNDNERVFKIFARERQNA